MAENARRKWFKRLGIGAALALLTAVGVGSLARANGGCHGPWGGHAESAADMQEMMERRAGFLLDSVDADDTQRAEVDAIVARAAPQLFALSKEGRALRQEMKEALLAEPLDQARLATAKQKLDQLASRMADTGFDSLVQVADVLTPEQRQQVADKLSRFHR
jgi:Spy/CpxP family protein refolding chaperone